MKICIASDIHANFNALLKFNTIIHEYDFIFLLGDFAGYNNQINEVIEYVKQLKNAYCLMGNHDYYLIHGIPSNANERVKNSLLKNLEIITNSNLSWLTQLPIQLDITLDEKKFLLQHGSPYKPLFEYIYPDYSNFASLYNLNFDYICMGHTHHSIIKTNGQQFILNPGSIGQPRDIRTSFSYVSLDTKTIPEIKRIPL